MRFDQKLLEQFHELRSIKADDRTVQHSIDRVMDRLTGRVSTAQTAKKTPPRLLIATGLAATILLAVWMVTSITSDQLAFADVQRELGRTKFVIFDRREGSEVFKVMAEAGGRIRMDDRHNSSVILKPTDDGTYDFLILDHERKTAELHRRFPAIPNLFDLLHNIQLESIRPLPERMIKGHLFPGFVAEIRMNPKKGPQEWRVWVDAKAKLPVWIEVDENYGKRTVRTVMANFTFVENLDQTVFDMTPPLGYKQEGMHRKK